jgi:hypothetical protein
MWCAFEDLRGLLYMTYEGLAGSQRHPIVIPRIWVLGEH